MKILKKEAVINNQKVIYYQLGQGSPVLFLHGGRVSALTFRKFLKLLARNHTVIAPDIPGYGESSTPVNVWSFIEYGVFFDNFLTALNLKNISTIGYSMGGGIAFNLAACSSRVSRLVLIDASGLKNSRGKHMRHDMRRLLFYGTHLSYLPAFFTLLRDYSSYAWKHRNDYRHMMRIRQKCFEQKYEEVFSKVSAPTLLVWGKDDWIYPIDLAYEFQRRLPHAKIEIVHGNHDWLVYNPLAGFSKIHQYL